jgi:3-dehydroquinate synthase
MNARPETLHRRLEWPSPEAATCEIRCGRGELSAIADRLAAAGLVAEGRLLLVCDPGAEAAIAEVERSLGEAGLGWRRIDVPAGESNKVQASVDRIVAEAIEWGIGRDTPLVAVGGGCVGDLAAFAASVLLRGVPLVLVPTTLMAMVDASIGGKTAINHRLADGSLGRNLVGSFHPARLVLGDPRSLATLPPREFRAGLAECVKHAMLDGEESLAFLEAHAGSLAALAGTPAEGDDGGLDRLLARSIAVKSRIVAEDPLERGSRRHLNLGHTYAHAIESLPQVPWRHGEAVSLGLVAAAAASVEAGWLDPAAPPRVAAMLDRLGLPTAWPGEAADGSRLRSLMRLDKKRSRGRLALVLLRGWGRPEVLADPPEAVVAAGWRAIGIRC